MKPHIRFWKFWTWHILLTIGSGVALFGGEIAFASPTMFLVAAFVGLFAYRLTTGVMTGAGKWLLYLIGTSSVMALLCTFPILAWIDHWGTEESPPLVLVVGWVVFLLAVLFAYQRRLFYRLVHQVHRSRMEHAELIAWQQRRSS